MTKIITCNVNGIRSATGKGLWEWLATQDADFICLQEVRAKMEHLPASAGKLDGYHAYFNLAERPGYSGVALYSKRKPQHVTRSMDWPEMDAEGRFLQLDFGNLSVISTYFPSGSASQERQYLKYDFLNHFTRLLEKFRKAKRDFIICGDINIAHKEIDIKNWKGNVKNSGFLPLERAWLDMVFDKLGYIDAFRAVNRLEDQFTWWSNRGEAYVKNVGWRIDYQIASQGLKDRVKSTYIYKDTRFSDHAPLIIEYDIAPT